MFHFLEVSTGQGLFLTRMSMNELTMGTQLSSEALLFYDPCRLDHPGHQAIGHSLFWLFIVLLQYHC